MVSEFNSGGTVAYAQGNLLEFFCWERCLHFVSRGGRGVTGKLTAIVTAGYKYDRGPMGRM
jgi:hypothetical protein